MSDVSNGTREILFRGKHIHVCPENEHLNGTWIYGYLCSEYYIDSPELEGELLVDPETICQFTGYEAIRRKKVFEHDIVFCEDNQHFGHIVFKDGGFQIEWERQEDYLREDIHFWFTERRMYVVGNIFDNPELMEGGHGHE